jgi:hypothetical protein
MRTGIGRGLLAETGSSISSCGSDLFVHPRATPFDGAVAVDRPNSAPPDPAPPEEEIPLGQRLFERPFLLLALGILIMVVFYTGWGLYEISSLTPAPLP